MTKEELIKSRENVMFFFNEEEDPSQEHYKKWDFIHGTNNNTPVKAGQFFLYECHLSNQYGDRQEKDVKSYLTYPKLGIYLNALPCDQTIEVEWVDVRRSAEWNLEYHYQFNGKDYTSYLAEEPTGIKRLPLWGDSMFVYGKWDKMPTWKELRPAYESTFWFYRTKEEIRDIQLGRILS